MSADAFVVRRTIAAAPERVFRAFSRPEVLERWIAPDPAIVTTVLRFEFVVGGAYELGFELPDGTPASVSGTYTDIEAPHRLAFSWCWNPPAPHAGIHTLVTVVLHEAGRSTELELRHERLGKGMSDRHREGWHASLARLPACLPAT